jgi:hypothetical protein
MDDLVRTINENTLEEIYHWLIQEGAVVRHSMYVNRYISSLTIKWRFRNSLLLR